MLHLTAFGAGLLCGTILSLVSSLKKQNSEAASSPGAGSIFHPSLKENESPDFDHLPRYFIPGQSAIVIVV